MPARAKGKGFLLYRAPDKNAFDPATGEPYDDLLVITTPTEVEKRALVEDESTPFFTIPALRRLQRRAGPAVAARRAVRDELEEIITDAWATKAPKKLVKEHLG